MYHENILWVMNFRFSLNTTNFHWHRARHIIRHMRGHTMLPSILYTERKENTFNLFWGAGGWMKPKVSPCIENLYMGGNIVYFFYYLIILYIIPGGKWKELNVKLYSGLDLCSLYHLFYGHNTKTEDIHTTRRQTSAPSTISSII